MNESRRVAPETNCPAARQVGVGEGIGVHVYAGSRSPEPRPYPPTSRATGQRAKTDDIDTAVLSAYGQALQPKPTAPRTEQEQQLAELFRRRVQVLEMLVAQRQQAARLTVPALRRQAQSLVIAWNER